MKIGISTACFYPMPTEETFQIIAEQGFDTIEIFLNSIQEAQQPFVDVMKKEIQKYGLHVRSIHPHCGAYEYLTLFSTYPRRHQDGINEYRDIIQTAKTLDADYITFHGDRTRTPLPTTLEVYCSTVKELMDLAAEQDIAIAQENVSWCKSSDLEFLKQVDHQLRPYGLYYTLDVKQAKRVGLCWQDYLPIMSGRLANVHISDQTEEQSCLLPGEGEMDYTQLFQALSREGYTGDFMVEVYQHNYKQYQQLKNSREFLKKQLELSTKKPTKTAI